jgi:dienelactone hydrolase
MPTKTSGFFLQRVSSAGGVLELIVPASTAPFGVAHHRRDGDDPAWRRVATFAEGLGAVAAASLIQSNFGDPGNLEVVARIGDRLAAFWCAAAPDPSWSGPHILAAGVAGNPALIQASYGQRGDFELVVPHAGGGIAHYYRDNDCVALTWHGPLVFGADVGCVDAVALIQSNRSSPGDLEVVARAGERLLFFRRASGPDLEWRGPYEVVSGVAGTPALLQSSAGRSGSSELIAPLAGVGLGHWVRDDDAPGAPWRGPDVFATALGRCEAVSLLQSDQGDPGRLELAVHAGGELLHWVRDGQSWSHRGTIGAAPRPTPPPVPARPRPPAPARRAVLPPQLRIGPHHAGFRRIAEVARSQDAHFPSTWAFDGAIYRAPEHCAALLYYPATADGEESPLAQGGPFPVIALAHERRLRASTAGPGAPSDLDQDYRQLAGAMAHLARWGFVVIAPDLSWLTPDDAPWRRAAVLRDALAHLRAGSKGPLLADFDRVGLMGHGLGALAAIALAGDEGSPFRVRALGLLAPLSGELGRLRRNDEMSLHAIMILHGTADPCAGDGPESVYAIARAPKHLVTVPGANHFGFTTSIALAEPFDGLAAIARHAQQAVAKGYLAAFFEHYLRDARDEADALCGKTAIEGLEGLDVAVRAELAPCDARG